MSRKAIGVTIKVTGNRDLVEEIMAILEQYCNVLHKSRMKPHKDDDGGHVYLDITEVNSVQSLQGSANK